VRLLRTLRDRILRTVLPDIEAGACIPEHGCCCGQPFIAQLNCFGTCVPSSSCSNGSRCF